MKGIGKCGILFLFLLSVNLAFTQRIGLSGGASVDPITSLRLAALYEQDIHPWLSLQTEFSYLQKGHSSLVNRLFSEPPGLGYGAIDVLSADAFLKLKLELSDFSFYLLGGVSLSSFVGAIAVYQGEDDIYQRVRIPLSAYQLKSWDWGGTIGLGLERRIRKQQKIFVDVRYYQGFNNLNRDPASVFYLESLYFNFGMIIPLHSARKNTSSTKSRQKGVQK